MTDNAFERFHALGYTRLTPIVPPSAEISEHSSLFKRIGTKQDGRGKTPGTKGRDGKWSSFDWTAYEAELNDLLRWNGMGAGVGIKCGGQLAAIDADTLDVGHATIIRDEIDAMFGRLPIRVGQSPKALYLIRLTEPMPYARIEFGNERVEVLTEGRQFVAHGIHPKTGKPYTWPRELVPFDQLPIATPEQINALLVALASKLPEASKVITEGATTAIAQASLTGTLETVTKAINALPNTSNHFPSRESYRDVGYAIKAALPDNEPEALDLFQSWCARWTDGENDPEVVEADWRRMKPPYRRGAGWLYEIAEQRGDFDRAEAWFEPIDESARPEPNPFAEVDRRPTDVYPLLTLDEIMSRTPPEFLIARHIPRQSVGFLYSVPGAGKSFLALDIALHISTSLSTWHGDPILADADSVVLYIAAEGSFGFRNRVRAWAAAHKLENLPNRFLMIERTIDFMSTEDIDKLLRTVAGAGRRPCFVVVDTVSRAMPGADENLQKEMTLFVRACDRLRDAFSCAVLGVHHAGKNGDMRGSTVLLGAGDFVFKLDRAAGATVGNLQCEKQKDGPDGWKEPYVFEAIDIGEGQSSLVVTRAELSIGPSRELTPAVSAAVLDAMEAAWLSGAPWSRAAQSGDRFAVRIMVREWGFGAVEAEELLRLWEGMGLVKVDMLSAKSKRKGLRVVREGGEIEAVEGVFQ